MTNRDMNLFDCIIYCTGDLTILQLRSKVASFIGSNAAQVSFVEKDFHELSIHTNDDFNFGKEKDFPDGFIYFRFIVEIGFTEKINLDKALPVVSDLLKWLWEMGMPAVASCDYENLLPENGGYNSRVVPWVH